MGDFKQMKREHEEVKDQLKALMKEFESLKAKMADKLDRDAAPDSNDVQHVSNTCDELMNFKMNTLGALENFSSKLINFSDRVEEIEKKLDDSINYSYQYNLKILDVPQLKAKETAEETTQLCLKIFSKIGVDVKDIDIDIAHRVPKRTQQYGRRRNSRVQGNNSIIYKFVRGVVKERVLAARANINRLNPQEFGLPEDRNLRSIKVLSHLTPKLQHLLGQAKTFQTEAGFKFCWAKSSAVFLRKSDNSRIYALHSLSDLDELRVSSPRIEEDDYGS